MRPALNSQTATTVTLQWTASDADTSDILTYDVYFGTENQPTIVTSATYYWKIVVKDNKGGQTIGQVWIFTTD